MNSVWGDERVRRSISLREYVGQTCDRAQASARCQRGPQRCAWTNAEVSTIVIGCSFNTEATSPMSRSVASRNRATSDDRELGVKHVWMWNGESKASLLAITLRNGENRFVGTVPSI